MNFKPFLIFFFLAIVGYFQGRQRLIFCGGIGNIPCPSGYACRLEGRYPDAGGRCLPLLIFSPKPAN